MVPPVIKTRRTTVLLQGMLYRECQRYYCKGCCIGDVWANVESVCSLTDVAENIYNFFNNNQFILIIKTYSKVVR